MILRYILPVQQSTPSRQLSNSKCWLVLRNFHRQSTYRENPYRENKKVGKHKKLRSQQKKLPTCGSQLVPLMFKHKNFTLYFLQKLYVLICLIFYKEKHVYFELQLCVGSENIKKNDSCWWWGDFAVVASIKSINKNKKISKNKDFL